MDTTDVQSIAERIMEAGENAENTINHILHNQGGKLIEEEIIRILPQSGRTWNRKKKAAGSTQPFQRSNENLAVIVKNKAAYQYLYFPDDGSNTKHHIGYHGIPRNFMKKGAENKTQEIINLCLGNLINGFGQEV